MYIHMDIHMDIRLYIVIVGFEIKIATRSYRSMSNNWVEFMNITNVRYSSSLFLIYICIYIYTNILYMPIYGDNPLYI